MALSSTNGEHYLCYRCEERGLLRVQCTHEVDEHTGACWVGNHFSCRGLVNSDGKRPCKCYCHVTEQDVEDAIASVTKTIEERSHGQDHAAAG